jgi:hypothetical protein
MADNFCHLLPAMVQFPVLLSLPHSMSWDGNTLASSVHHSGVLFTAQHISELKTSVNYEYLSDLVHL